MVGKRKAPPRRPAAFVENIRPWRNVDSTYTAPIQDDGDTETRDQQPMSEVKQAPSITPKQELQQLQAQLQAMQQKRDKVAAAYAASQQAMQTSA
jgi:hypothetical protein